MGEYLLLRLYGPMASWGGIAVGEVRPSDVHPTHAAMIGLLAAALGIRRQQEEALTALAEGYAMAVRVDAPGVLLRDYHTVQTPSAVDMKGRPRHCRSDQLVVPRHQLKTLLTTREYHCDAWYTVALVGRAAAPHRLSQLASALENPCFPLYLGRKSCPLALPLQPQVVEAATLAEAFGLVRFHEERFFQIQGRGWTGRDRVWPLSSESPTVHWDPVLDGEGLEPLLSIVRRDHPLHRRRWQFAERPERHGRLTPPAMAGD
ncbi:MAG: type I-E CRISPR-associated protein Cas5/CasD [Magnetococcales bacterium]|nr:type I-E CRISPR-associated protein Cas5/CasD [Magnetococcales bacterium]